MTHDERIHEALRLVESAERDDAGELRDPEGVEAAVARVLSGEDHPAEGRQQ